MALAFQASDNTSTIGPFFKRSQNVDHIYLAAAGYANDFDVRRVLQSHRTCQVRCCVTSEIAAKCNNDRIKIDEITLERQCDQEYVEEIRDVIDQYDAVVSLACGVGVQFTAEQYPSTMIYPGVNTCFMGATEKRGLWTERCQGCGQCLLATTGSICPVARCAKRLFNGPCGGSTTGKCEINAEVDCAWQLIVDRMKALDKLDQYETLCPIKDWSTDRAGGPRKVAREDVQQ